MVGSPPRPTDRRPSRSSVGFRRTVGAPTASSDTRSDKKVVSDTHEAGDGDDQSAVVSGAEEEDRAEDVEVRDRDPFSPTSRLAWWKVALWAGGLAAAVALVFAAVFLIRDGSPDRGVDSGVMPSTTTARIRVAPSGPGTDPELTDPAVEIGFAQDVRDGLPSVVDGPAWQVLAGTWRTADGRALGLVDNSELALAVLDVGSGPLRAQVALPDAAVGAGLAFDIVSLDDFQAWVAVPGYATVNLLRVSNGELEQVMNSGLTRVQPGVRLGIVLEPDRTLLLANGAVVATIEGEREGEGVGLIVSSPSSAAAFDDLAVQYG